MSNEHQLNLENLILWLKKFYPYTEEARPDCLKFILCYTQLVEVLEKINEMVGMKQIKDNIALSLRSLIVYYAKHGTTVKGQTMNTLLISEPGMGKTQMGAYLAEFWTVTGCLRQKPTEAGTSNFKWTESAEADLKLTGSLSPRNNPPSSRATSFDKQPQLQSQSFKQANENVNINVLFNRSVGERALTLVNRIRRHSSSRHQTIDREYQELKTLINKLSGNDNNEMMTTTPLRVTPFHPEMFKQQQQQQEISWWKKPETRVQSIFRVLTRADFISRIQGGSTYQLRKILKECEGGCVMIDEAYSMITSDDDSFGKETLAEIVSVMSTYDCIMFIFAGYKDSIEELAKRQPGLKSRFNYTYEIHPYTPEELFQIFQYHCKQMKITNEIKFDPEIFNRATFPAYGRDIRSLVQICHQQIYDQSWINLCLGLPMSSDVTLNVTIFETAYQNYLKSKNHLKPKDTTSYEFIYS